MTYPVGPGDHHWKDEEVIRALLKGSGRWMTPEQIRRAHGFPKGCSQSARVRYKLVELIDEELVEGKYVAPTWPQKGYKYRLTSKGLDHAKRMGWC